LGTPGGGSYACQPRKRLAICGFFRDKSDLLVAPDGAGEPAGYRTEIEEMIDLGDRVVSVICDYGRREPGAPEVALKSAVVWTVRDGRIVRAEFYPGGRAEALEAAGLSA
jgi:hypothetical protein